MEEQQEQRHKTPLSLDWNTLLDEAAPPEIVVKSSSAMASDQTPAPSADCFDELTDYQLEESIGRKKKLLEVKLPDGGAKLRSTIQRLEEEISRRKIKRREKAVEDEKKARQATSSNAVGEGVSNDSRKENTSSEAQPQSSFASSFIKKMEDNADVAFRKEISQLKHCNNQTVRDNGEPKGRKRFRSSSRKIPFQCPSNLSNRGTFNNDNSYRAASSFSLRNIGRNLSRCYPKVKDASQVIQSDGSKSRKGQPIVLDDDNDDDDEPHILEKTETLEITDSKLDEYLKEAKIYFPSRDDPECVEVCYKDIGCLAPEGYLTSTIMNFYIRYLQEQASLTNRSLSDYHFFNTYFYNKLKEAVSCKQSDRETTFAKFRRWWKGVNIFRKAYVLIPIHEDLHWSLIIICFPDKEDESGPIILHLDSLGLHSSRSVFENIKSYLIEEKNFLDRECLSSDVSIADRIWNCLPRRIETQAIAVPQQRNDYDCGLFVLYFIERFMEEAHERLKKKDLAMFGKQWFKPEEASSLRVKIRKLLLENLKNSISHHSISESPVASPSVGTVTECAETSEESLT